MSDSRGFPVMCPWAGMPRSERREAEQAAFQRVIPWEVIRPHEAQARHNHGGQSLDRLAERGGLSPSEAVAVLEDRRWHSMLIVDAIRRLVHIVGKATEAQ